MKLIDWLKDRLGIDGNEAFWEQQLQEQRKRHAREILARLDVAGIRSDENSAIDGFSDRELRGQEGQQGG